MLTNATARATGLRAGTGVWCRTLSDEFHRDYAKIVRREKRHGALYSIEVNALNIGGWVLVPFSMLGQYLICPRCGNRVSSVSSYCNFCGTLLQPMLVLRICPNCKSRIPASARFCPECGQKQPGIGLSPEKRAKKTDTKGWSRGHLFGHLYVFWNSRCLF